MIRVTTYFFYHAPVFIPQKTTGFIFTIIGSDLFQASLSHSIPSPPAGTRDNSKRVLRSFQGTGTVPWGKGLTLSGPSPRLLWYSLSVREVANEEPISMVSSSTPIPVLAADSLSEMTFVQETLRPSRFSILLMIF